MVTAVWKMRRLWAVETGLWSKTAANRPETTAIGRITGAFSDLSRQPELHPLLRYEARFHHAYHPSAAGRSDLSFQAAKCNGNIPVRALQHFLAFEELSGDTPNLDPNKSSEIIDVRAGLQVENKSNYQTNLDGDNPNALSGVDPISSGPAVTHQ
jgi:hypothetical protein